MDQTYIDESNLGTSINQTYIHEIRLLHDKWPQEFIQCREPGKGRLVYIVRTGGILGRHLDLLQLLAVVRSHVLNLVLAIQLAEVRHAQLIDEARESGLPQLPILVVR